MNFQKFLWAQKLIEVGNNVQVILLISKTATTSRLFKYLSGVELNIDGKPIHRTGKSSKLIPE